MKSLTTVPFNGKPDIFVSEKWTTGKTSCASLQYPLPGLYGVRRSAVAVKRPISKLRFV